MDGHRQGIGRVQDTEAPGRKRSGDGSGTEVLERCCDVRELSLSRSCIDRH